ncbi:MAG: hypothetical protein ACLQMF_20235 [Rectinemataceae bacterium]
MMIALRLAKAGYYGGDPERALEARVDHVLAAIEFERFVADYELVNYELNKGGT